MEYITQSSSQTKLLGKKLAKKILKSKPYKNALVFALQGDLGSGKTTFIQGLAQGLNIKEKITSPTFIILKRFRLNNATIEQFNNFYHIDCYRIKNAKEMFGLGLKEILADPKNIVVIEWSKRIKKILPKNIFWIKFKFISANKREIFFNKTLF